MSKPTIVRKIDDLGRLVLPKDVRKILNIHTGDLLALTPKENVLEVTKYSSIQEIHFLVEILLDTIYEKYHIEGILLEGENLICYPSIVSYQKIKEKRESKDSLKYSLLREEKEIGKLVFFTSDERYQELFSFLTFFLRKYLEEC